MDWTEIHRIKYLQSVSLGLFRSDYLMQNTESNKIKQVEFNTVASSFGAMTSFLPTMSRYRHRCTAAVMSGSRQSDLARHIASLLDYLLLPRTQTLTSTKQLNISHVAAVLFFYLHAASILNHLVLRVSSYIFVFFRCLLHSTLCFILVADPAW